MGNERRKKVINNEGSKKNNDRRWKEKWKNNENLGSFYFKFVLTSINFFTKKMLGVRILFKQWIIMTSIEAVEGIL